MRILGSLYGVFLFSFLFRTSLRIIPYSSLELPSPLWVFFLTYSSVTEGASWDTVGTSSSSLSVSSRLGASSLSPRVRYLAVLPPYVRASYRILAPRSVTESYGVFCVHSSLTVSSVTVLLRTELLGYGPYGVSTVFLLSLRYSSS